MNVVDVVKFLATGLGDSLSIEQISPKFIFTSTFSLFFFVVSLVCICIVHILLLLVVVSYFQFYLCIIQFCVIYH